MIRPTRSAAARLVRRTTWGLGLLDLPRLARRAWALRPWGQLSDGRGRQEEWPFVLADGRQVSYGIAWIRVRIDGRTQPT
ncbi:MAG: hypothetical protein ACREKF_02210, partial [Candidatus Methylomirabilales bacterium]